MGFLLQMFQKFSPTILDGNSLFPLPHTLSCVSGFGWVNESVELCVVCEGRRWGWQGSVVLIFPFPSEDF